MMLSSRLEKYNVILASGSPRRKTILEELGIKFNVAQIQIDEDTYPADLDKFRIPVYLAEQKSLAFGAIGDNDLLITADTIVWMEGRVINKPSDYQDAINMLTRISGNMHEVITGVTIRTIHDKYSFTSHTEVFFSELSNEEITYYIMKYKPYDKAGAYGIQEWIGYVGIERINGSYYNVMGLPVQKLYRVLETFLK